MNLYHQKPTGQPRKPPQHPAAIAIQAGLHPASKTVQGLMGVNRKKEQT